MRSAAFARPKFRSRRTSLAAVGLSPHSVAENKNKLAAAIPLRTTSPSKDLLDYAHRHAVAEWLPVGGIQGHRLPCLEPAHNLYIGQIDGSHGYGDPMQRTAFQPVNVAGALLKMQSIVRHHQYIRFIGHRYGHTNISVRQQSIVVVVD